MCVYIIIIIYYYAIIKNLMSFSLLCIIKNSMIMSEDILLFSCKMSTFTDFLLCSLPMHKIMHAFCIQMCT